MTTPDQNPTLDNAAEQRESRPSDDEIERMAALGYSNRDIAVMAKCSPQNIDQIRQRIRRTKRLPLCVKLTDDQRRADKARLRAVLGMEGV